MLKVRSLRPEAALSLSLLFSPKPAGKGCPGRVLTSLLCTQPWLQPHTHTHSIPGLASHLLDLQACWVTSRISVSVWHSRSESGFWGGLGWRQRESLTFAAAGQGACPVFCLVSGLSCVHAVHKSTLGLRFTLYHRYNGDLSQLSAEYLCPVLAVPLILSCV